MSNAMSMGVVIGGALSPTVGRSFKTLEQQAGETSKRLKKLEIGKTQVESVLKYRAEIGHLSEQFKAGVLSEKEVATQVGRVTKKMEQASKKARTLGIDTKHLASEHQRLGVEIGKTSRAMARQETRLRNRAARREMGGQMLGLVGMAYAASAPVNAALDFDKSQRRLGTLLGDDDLAAARKQAMSFGRENLIGESEMLDINYALNSAGLDASAARAGAEIVAKVKEVAGGSAETVGEVVGTVFNNLAGSLAGNAEQKLARIGDVLTKTQMKYQIRDFNQLGESFKEGSKGAIKYNVDLEQTAAALGQFNSAGMQGSSAGTAFNAMLRQMGKASEEFGFSVQRNADGSLDLMATLSGLEQSLAIFDDPDEKADALQKVFGDEGSGVVLLLNNLEKLKEGYAEVKNESQGIVDSGYQKILDSDSGKWQLATKQVSNLGISLGRILVPGLNAVLSPFGTVVRTVAEASEKFPLLTTTVVGGGAAIVGLTGALVAGKYAATFFSDGWAIGSKIIEKARKSTLLMTVAQWALNVAMKANPIGLIITGLGVLAAGGVWLYKTWEPFQKLVDTIWEGIKTVFNYTPIGMLIKAGQTIFGSDETKAAAVKMPNVAPAGGTSSSTVNAPITIHAAPGMDEKAIADQVDQKLRERESYGRARHRGRLYD